jgi:hypothetical protein
MSSLFRNRLIAGVAFASAAAFAQQVTAQTYVVPSVEVSSEYHTNRELTPTAPDATTGYIATAQALMGKRTPRSQTELRPRVRFQEYPQRSGVDPLDVFLDLQSDFRTLTSEYSLLASFSRQDTFNAEFGSAGIDTTGPETPTAHNDTGIVFIGNTRTEFSVEPSFNHDVTERTSLGGTVGFDNVDYQNVAANAREDYRDVYLNMTLQHEIRPQTDFEIGPYVSRYETKTDANRTDSAGVTFSWNHDVSKISHTEFSTSVERTKIEDPTVVSGQETQTNWGAEFKGYLRGQASRLDYGIGRYLAASGIGSKIRRDELRLQYSRQLTPRFDYRGAVRGGSEQRLGFVDDSRDRNYVRAEFFVRWFMTPTIYISGGYRFSWQKYKSFTGGADDNAALVLFGYRGLDIRRSAVRGSR